MPTEADPRTPGEQPPAEGCGDDADAIRKVGEFLLWSISDDADLRAQVVHLLRELTDDLASARSSDVPGEVADGDAHAPTLSCARRADHSPTPCRAPAESATLRRGALFGGDPFLWCGHACLCDLRGSSSVTADLIRLAVFGAAAVVACWRLSPAAVLTATLALDVLQVFATDAFAVSFATVWQLAAVVALVRARGQLPRLRLVAGLFSAYLLLSVAALAWSPDREAGLALCAQLFGLGVTTALAVVVIRQRRTTLPLAVFTALLGVSAVSILIFRFVPSLEDQYFHSALFGLLNGHGLADGFFTTDRNNVLDKAKSGGLFFVNANAASLFSGAGGALAALLALRQRGVGRAAAGSVLGLDLAAVLATGSKSGLYLSVLAIGVLALVIVVRLRRRAVVALGLLLSGALAVFVAVLVVAPGVAQQTSAVQSASPAAEVSVPPTEPSVALDPKPASEPAAEPPLVLVPAAAPLQPDLAVRSMDAIGTRFDIWRIGLRLAQQHPYGGFGFGGWAGQYGPLAPAGDLNPAFPPHNWPLQVWSDTGALSLFVVLLLLAAIVRTAVSHRRGGSPDAAASRILGVIAFGWVLLHGLADNTGVYGGPRLIAITAVAIALLLERRPGRLDRSSLVTRRLSVERPVSDRARVELVGD
ncbi:O-antigen ligase family protein [Amnibacterium endophyticum]|uniref:O-antigen ligase family protein n=1 Tax=Amnibacterium endophyticum TaxID=2109337 RepID=A0ABW4LBB5_9MICO